MLVRLRNHCAYMAALRTAFKVHSLCICAHRVACFTVSFPAPLNFVKAAAWAVHVLWIYYDGLMMA